MAIEHLSQAHLPSRFGTFLLHVFRDENGCEHMAAGAGKMADPCLVRIHSECATGDILGSLRCDCRDQLEAAMKQIGAAPSGLFIYMRGHEGRGIGLGNKIKAYALQEEGLNTIDANLRLGFPSDMRHYRTAAEILRYFGISQINLLTNNQDKVREVEQNGIHVATRVPLWTATNPYNQSYIETKQTLMGHFAPVANGKMD